MFDERKANRVVKFFESLRHTKGVFAGKPFTLLAWENSIIRDVYGTLNARGTRQYKYVYVEVPKKNGKSELVAGAGIYQLYADGEKNGEVYGCAADREQASIVFDVVVDMIDQVPELKKRTKLNLSKRMITDKVSGSIYRVLSAEAYTKHGLNVSACIFDELHAQPNRGLWDVMTFGAGDARLQPIWWIITTAGDDPDRVSIGWEQHEKAVKLLAGEWQDPTWYPVIYSYDGDDIYNPDNWAKANPSMGHTITVDTVREASEKAQQSKANERLFRWLRLNQWITTKLTTWLPVDLFEQTTGYWDRASLIGEECYLGMDLSSTTDLTALCWVFPPQGDHLDWRVIWDCFIPENNMAERIKQDRVPYDQWAAAAWITATPGDVVDYTKIEERILQMSKLYKVVEVDADRTFAAMLLQRLEQAGLVCVDIPQQYATLTDPMNLVEILLKNKKLTHEPNPVAKWCFGNTSIHKNGNAQIKYVKELRGRTTIRTKRIDLTAAWICAMARAKFHSGSVDLSTAILDEGWGM